MTDEKGKKIKKKAFKSLCIIEIFGIVITTKKRLYRFMDFVITMNTVDSFMIEINSEFKKLMTLPKKKSKRTSTARKHKRTNTGKKRVSKPKPKNKKK